VGQSVTNLFFFSFFVINFCYLLNSVISDPRSSVFVTCVPSACQRFDSVKGSADTHRIF
jgi:hypothetical protein